MNIQKIYSWIVHKVDDPQDTGRICVDGMSGMPTSWNENKDDDDYYKLFLLQLTKIVYHQ